MGSYGASPCTVGVLSLERAETPSETVFGNPVKGQEKAALSLSRVHMGYSGTGVVCIIRAIEQAIFYSVFFQP